MMCLCVTSYKHTCIQALMHAYVYLHTFSLHFHLRTCIHTNGHCIAKLKHNFKKK